MKGTVQENIDYCTKSETAISSHPCSNWWQPSGQPKGWQIEVMQLLEEAPSKRKIHWFWEEEGNMGKSWLTKYIYDNNPDTTLVLSGKASDAFYIIQQAVQQKNYPKTIIFDVPRSMENYISWQAIEKIKDGLLCSTKYEGGVISLPWTPHILCFANFIPPKEKLSMDRWDIRIINEKNCIQHN